MKVEAGPSPLFLETVRCMITVGMGVLDLDQKRATVSVLVR